MLDRKAFIGIVAVSLCAQSAIGATKSVATLNSTGSAARAGSLRVTPASKTSTATASKSTVSKSSGGDNESLTRVTTSAASGLGTKNNKLTQSSAAAKTALAELEGRVEELSRTYGTLGDQYNRLANDISYASTTATSAKTMAETNRTQLALKMNSGDFADAFDTRLSAKNLASADSINNLSVRVGTTESGVNSLTSRVGTAEGRINNLEQHPGVDAVTINGMIDSKISDKNLADKGEVNSALLTAQSYANTKASESLQSAKDYADNRFGTKEQISNINSTLDTKANKSELNFLCDNPDFQVSVTGSDENAQANVRMMCNGTQRGQFTVPIGAGGSGHDGCTPTITYTDKDSDGCYTITTTQYTVGSTGVCVINSNITPNPSVKRICDGQDSCPPLVKNTEKDENNCYRIKTVKQVMGANGVCTPDETTAEYSDQICPVCGIDMASEDAIDSQNRVIGQNITFRNSCNNQPIGPVVPIINGQDACPPLVENTEKDENNCYRIKTTSQEMVGGVCKPITSTVEYSDQICPTCGIDVESEDARDSQNRVIGKNLTFRNSCTNLQIGSSISILNGQNGTGGTITYVYTGPSGTASEYTGPGYLETYLDGELNGKTPDECTNISETVSGGTQINQRCTVQTLPANTTNNSNPHLNAGAEYIITTGLTIPGGVAGDDVVVLTYVKHTESAPGYVKTEVNGEYRGRSIDSCTGQESSRVINNTCTVQDLTDVDVVPNDVHTGDQYTIGAAIELPPQRGTITRTYHKYSGMTPGYVETKEGDEIINVRDDFCPGQFQQADSIHSYNINCTVQDLTDVTNNTGMTSGQEYTLGEAYELPLQRTPTFTLKARPNSEEVHLVINSGEEDEQDLGNVRGPAGNTNLCPTGQSIVTEQTEVEGRQKITLYCQSDE